MAGEYWLRSEEEGSGARSGGQTGSQRWPGRQFVPHFSLDLVGWRLADVEVTDNTAVIRRQRMVNCRTHSAWLDIERIRSVI